MKKSLLIIPLSFSLLLGACSSTNNVPQTPEEKEQEVINFFGFELKRKSISTEAIGYDLASQIEYFNGKTINDITFSSSNIDVATVNSEGQIVRKNYGSVTIVVARKDAPLLMDTFTISFLPDINIYKGKYEAQLTNAVGHDDEEVNVVIDIKNATEFTITYSAGYFSYQNEDDQAETGQIETPLEANGTYTYEGALRFTVTSTDFPFRKTFGGQLKFEEDNSFIRSRVPVTVDKTSNMTYFEKVVE